MINELGHSQEELWQQVAPGEEIPLPSAQEQFSTFLRIHGDNILECERALLLIADSYHAQIRLVDSPPYLPRYEIHDDSKVLYTVELLSGHKRWNFDLQAILQEYGAPLREATDAVVTQVSPDSLQEEVKCAFEFCNALPAGNNAWQRNGRALSCATVGVPYLYFAEIGGVELDVNRVIKAPRFPNPIVPFSYITVGRSFNMICIPVYLPSPTSTNKIRIEFEDAFGEEEGRKLIRQIIEGTSPNDTYQKLTQKALLAVEKLAERQQNKSSTLRGDQWNQLLSIKEAFDKAEWLKQNAGTWFKRRGNTVHTSETFKALVLHSRDLQFISVGARYIPICFVHGDERAAFAATLSQVYGEYLSEDFIKWVVSKDSPLIIVWITGFKPHGEDSRPDRGLVPMARMLFGNNIDLLSIVFGPGLPPIFKQLKDSPQQLVTKSGFWQSIINLSDGILADSIVAPPPLGLLLKHSHRNFQGVIRFPSTSSAPSFSEMDVDSTLHLLFARQEALGVFEGMCNPPGGDWSGLSVIDDHIDQEFRWTSLPRVSGKESKRPDHVIQFFSDSSRSVLLAIESKDLGSDVEENVGSRLSLYVQRLIQTSPTITRQSKQNWNLWTSTSVPVPSFSVISGGAFQWKPNGAWELDDVLARSRLDIVFAVEFNEVKQSVTVHVKATPSAAFLLPKIHELAQHFGTRLKIQEH